MDDDDVDIDDNVVEDYCLFHVCRMFCIRIRLTEHGVEENVRT